MQKENWRPPRYSSEDANLFFPHHRLMARNHGSLRGDDRDALDALMAVVAIKSSREAQTWHGPTYWPVWRRNTEEQLRWLDKAGSQSYTRQARAWLSEQEEEPAPVATISD